MANKIPRVPVREQNPARRATNFEEVCYGYDEKEAVLEASRCLNCINIIVFFIFFSFSLRILMYLIY